jgi:hypothetical protein
VIRCSAEKGELCNQRWSCNPSEGEGSRGFDVLLWGRNADAVRWVRGLRKCPGIDAGGQSATSRTSQSDHATLAASRGVLAG